MPDTTEQRATLRAIANGAAPLDQLPQAIADFADALAEETPAAATPAPAAQAGSGSGSPTVVPAA